MMEQDMDNTRSFTPISKGTMVSHYKIIEKIGAGGMGEVYLAEDTRLGRRVAIKFLPSQLTPDQEIQTRFVREARTIAKLNHPNVVSIYDVSEFKGRPFYVMELVEGKSLHHHIDEKPLPIDLVIEYSIQICLGLGEAHRAGIIHRDIKPANILVDGRGRIRLLDFGLAAIVGDDGLTRTGSTLGTVSYMSPEQVSGRDIDHRSDLFSLGVVLYELIAGRSPFKRDNEGATLKAIIEDHPEPLTRYKSDIPDGLLDTVMKLLEKDKELRYQSAEGVIADLKRLVYDSTQSGYSRITTEKPKKKPIARVLAAAAVLTAAVLYLILGTTNEKRSTADMTPMIAVIPFENLGAADDEYFADGITNEITSRVATLKGLGVIARTSVLQYKGTQKRVSEIGAELNVNYILEGTIRWDKSGEVDKVRITPQLIRVSDETHLWTDNFQRDLSEIFDVQEDIATSIAEALNIALVVGGDEFLDYRPTDNMEAYDNYLKARNYIDHSDILKAIELLDKATKLDSNFALAFALKSQAHSLFAFGEMPASEHSKPARLAYNRAFEIQPDLAEAHLARGVYLNMIERDYAGALKEFEIARRGNVDKAQVLGAISVVKIRQGKWNEAIALDRQVIKLDPRSSRAGFITMQANWFIHRYDEALAATERLISLDPDEQENFLYKAMIQVCMGEDVERIQETLSEWSRRATGVDYIWELEGLTFIILLHLWNQSIDLDAKILAVKEELRRSPNPRLYYNAGLLYQYKGDKDSTYKYMNSTILALNNRIAQARSDTTGRFEIFNLSHDVYDLLAMAYSLTNKHEQAIEHAQLAMEAMPVEACHW
jgi:non-specific serine/threonine protein kinase